MSKMSLLSPGGWQLISVSQAHAQGPNQNNEINLFSFAGLVYLRRYFIKENIL